MADFDRKEWLDRNLIDLLHQDPPASIYTVFWDGAPPKEVLVFLLPSVPSPPEGPPAAPADDHWPRLVKRLLDDGFRFDYLRDVQLVEHEGQRVALFGGDGAPLFDKSGAVSVRVFKKLENGTNLILQVGHRYPTGVDAALAVKAFFAQWDTTNPMKVCQELGATFGQA